MAHENKDLFITIPYLFRKKTGNVEDAIAALRDMHKRYGYTIFILACPSTGNRAYGFPSLADYEAYAREFLAVKEAVEPEGIRLGWWWATNLKTGRDDRYPPMIRSDGSETPVSSDPFDDGYRDAVAKRVARFAAIAHPAFIFTEDDYSIFAATGGGCFCEKHLAEFSRRMGHTYTRDELNAALKGTSPEAYEITRKWMELNRDTLVLLAEAIRAELDKETPEIPMGLMQTGHADREGAMTEAVCRALAGPRHRPFCRHFGVDYGGMRNDEISAHVFHALYDREHLPEDFVFIHESDPFPQSRFFTAGKQMLSLMSLVYSYGFDGSTYNITTLSSDSVIGEDTYGSVNSAALPRLSALHKSIADCRLAGVHLPYDRFYNSTKNLLKTENPLWHQFVSFTGIPYTTRDAAVYMMDERDAKFRTDEELKKILSGGVILDGETARLLCERGFSADLGITVGESLTEDGMFRFDLAATEVLTESCKDGNGRCMPTAHLWAPRGNGVQYRLEPTDPSCEVLTETVDYLGNKHGAAMTRYKNDRGGRIVVMGQTLAGNYSQSLFNYVRAKLIKNLIAWCGGDLLTTVDTAKVDLTVNVPTGDADFHGIATLINFGEDGYDSIAFRLPAGWENGKVEQLNEQGQWVAADASLKPGRAEVAIPLAPLTPTFLRFAK